MSSSTGHGSLFLHPGQSNFTLEDISPLVSLLQEIGFISHSINTTDNCQNFFTGDQFLEYIAYLGCSPAIQFAASTSSSEVSNSFCHIKLHLYDSTKLIISLKQTRAPHCPSCSKPVKNWKANKTDTQILCDHCNTSSDIAEFNWRKMAGYARLFIEITDIFPKEAIPQQLLLDKLAKNFNTDWSYFYNCQ